MEEEIELLENYCKALQGKHLDNRVRAIQNLLQAYKEDEAVIEKLKRQAKMTAEEFEKVHNLLDKTIELILDDLPDNGYTKEELFRSYENRAKNILEIK